MLTTPDEAETILRMRRDVRGKSLNGIRQICDAASSYPGLLWCFTGTPEFFDHKRGVASLPPLHDRIRFKSDQGFASIRQPQMALEPFDAQRLREVALRLRELYPGHDRARLEARITPAFIEQLVSEVSAGFGGDVGVVPRQFLRELVHRMDLVDEHPDYDPMAASTRYEPSDLSIEESRAVSGGEATQVPIADDEDGEALIPVADVW